MEATFADRAEIAVARADVAHKHERGGTMTPTLADVGTLRLFADGVEVVLAERALEKPVAFAARHAGANPIGKSPLRRGLYRCRCGVHGRLGELNRSELELDCPEA